MRSVTALSYKGKKEAPVSTTSDLILHQLFEQILYIPLIVFIFLHQPTDAVYLVPLLQKLGKRPIECGLPPLDHAAILLHGICRFADGKPLAHGLICLAVGYADVLLPLPDELVSP